jgi:hypothetical protein
VLIELIVVDKGLEAGIDMEFTFDMNLVSMSAEVVAVGKDMPTLPLSVALVV